MSLLAGVFAEAGAAGVAGTPPALARRVDGALLLTGSLASQLKRKAPYKDQVPALVARVILPLFASPHGHLRAKAAWAGSRFADAPLAAGGPPDAAHPPCAGAGPTFDALFAATAGALADPNLPVRVEAAAALRALVEALDEGRVPAFAAGLPTLLRPLLSVLGELDSEELMCSLEALVDKVGPAIAPYATELTGQLVAAYSRMAGLGGGGGGGGGAPAPSPTAAGPSAPGGAAAAAAASPPTLTGSIPGDQAPALVVAQDEGGGGGDDDGGDDAAMAAYGVLRALLTILDAVSGLPGAVAALSPALVPLLAAMLDPARPAEESLEEALDLLAYLTFFSPALTPPLWSLFPRLVAVYHAWAPDFLDSVATALANYMTRGTAAFVGGGPSSGEVVAALAGTHLAPAAAARAAAAGDPAAWALPGGGRSYADAVLGIAGAALADGDAAEEDAAAAPRLLAVMLLATAGAGLAPGALDRAVGLALARLPTATGSTLRSRLVCVVAAALHADVGAALAALAARGATGAFFAGWVGMLGERRAGRRGGGGSGGGGGHAAAAAHPSPPPPALRHFKAAQDKRVCVLGLAAALAAPAGSVPPELEAGGPALLGAGLAVLEAWRAQADADARAGGSDDDGGGRGGAFGWGGSGSEEDSEEEGAGGQQGGGGGGGGEAASDDDDSFLVRLARAAGRRSAGGGGGGGDSDGSSWSDDDDDYSDGEDEVDTPATAVDPGAVLLRAVEAARVVAPARLAGVDGAALERAAAGVAAAARADAERAAARAAAHAAGNK